MGLSSNPELQRGGTLVFEGRRPCLHARPRATGRQASRQGPREHHAGSQSDSLTTASQKTSLYILTRSKGWVAAGLGPGRTAARRARWRRAHRCRRFHGPGHPHSPSVTRVTMASLYAPSYRLRGATLEPYRVLDNRVRLPAADRGRAEAGRKGTRWNLLDEIWERSRWRRCHSPGRLPRRGSTRSSGAFRLAPSLTASIGSPVPTRKPSSRRMSRSGWASAS